MRTIKTRFSCIYTKLQKNYTRKITEAVMMMMMMMMMMMNCFSGMVDLISSRDHCQRFSPSQISSTPRAGLEPAQNLSSDFVEWSCFKIFLIILNTLIHWCSWTISVYILHLDYIPPTISALSTDKLKLQTFAYTHFHEAKKCKIFGTNFSEC